MHLDLLSCFADMIMKRDLYHREGRPAMVKAIPIAEDGLQRLCKDCSFHQEQADEAKRVGLLRAIQHFRSGYLGRSTIVLKAQWFQGLQ